MAQARAGGAFQPGSWRVAMWVVIGLLLVTPLVAMRFTGEVNWTVGDFLVAGTLLIGGGAAYEIAVRIVRSKSSLTLIASAIVVVVALIWAQGAVGIF